MRVSYCVFESLTPGDEHTLAVVSYDLLIDGGLVSSFISGHGDRIRLTVLKARPGLVVR